MHAYQPFTDALFFYKIYCCHSEVPGKEKWSPSVLRQKPKAHANASVNPFGAVDVSQVRLIL